MEPSPINAVALFRYEVIAPLLALTPGRGVLKRAIAKRIESGFDHPRRGRVHLGYGTVEEWIYLYRGGGLAALVPVRRRDRGRSRRIADEAAERIEDLATGERRLDGPGILEELRADPETRHAIPSLSTLYRFLRARGIDLAREAPTTDRRAFAFDLAGDCWQVDVMYGPSIATKAGTRRKTYLIAVLDDATRLVAHAEFYFEQHLRSLKDALKQAFLKRGLPRRLYADNGKIFRSRLLLAVCARLGIHLIHTRPYLPQGRGKLERFFGTVRRGFLRRVDLPRVESLAALNRLLFAFIEGEYHVRRHRGIGGETPLDRFVRLSGGLRPLPADVDLDDLLLDEVRRRVRRDGTFTLLGKTFEAGPLFVSEKVVVRYDPFDLRRVRVELERGGPVVAAFPVDLAGNRHVARQRPEAIPPKPAPPLRALEERARRLEEEGGPGVRPAPAPDAAPDDTDPGAEQGGVARG